MAKAERDRAYKHKAWQELSEQGYTVIKATVGPYDLIAFRGNEKPRCIQIKRTKAQAGLKTLLSNWKPPQPDNYSVELWVWYRGTWYRSLRLDPQARRAEDANLPRE